MCAADCVARDTTLIGPRSAMAKPRRSNVALCTVSRLAVRNGEEERDKKHR